MAYYDVSGKEPQQRKRNPPVAELSLDHCCSMVKSKAPLANTSVFI